MSAPGPGAMSSTRPYLLRAIYDWVVDNGCTPHLLVAADEPGVQVPRQYVKNGVIVLNVAPGAVRDLRLGDERVEFSARFAGTPHQIVVPIAAVQAIYARENGQGLVLGESGDESGGRPPEPPADPPSGGGSRPPTLTVVK